MSESHCKASWAWKALILSQAFFLIYSAWFFGEFHRLPAPFFYDVGDTFMDFFNTNYWAFSPYKYQDWHSIYPILTFLLAQVITPLDCSSKIIDSMALRECAIYSVWVLFFCYFVSVSGLSYILAGRFFPDISRVKLFPFMFFAIFFCLPGLYGVERGNYIVFALFFLVASQLFPIGILSLFFIALAINIKQYLVVVLFAYLLKRRADLFVLGLLMVVLINFCAWLFVFDDNYLMIFENMSGFSSGAISSYFEKMWYPTSVSAWVKSVNGASIFNSFSDIQKDFLFSMVYVLKIISIFMIIYVACKLMRDRDKLAFEDACFTFILMLLVMTESLGGYALILLLPFLTSGIFRRNPIIISWCLFFILTPLDIVIGPNLMLIHDSFLWRQELVYYAGLTLGSYLRPMTCLVLLYICSRSFYRNLTQTFV